MKILITTCGVGIGHASRDLALAKNLEIKGYDVEFASYNSGTHYLEKNKKTVYNLPSMNFQQNNGELDIEKTIKKSKDIPLTFLRTIFKEFKIIRKTRPDIIIADSDYSTPFVAKILKKPCYIITNDLTFGFAQSTNKRFIKYFEGFIRKLIQIIAKKATAILIPDIPGTVQIPEKLKDKTEFIGPLLHNNIDDIWTKEQLREKYDMDYNQKIIVVTIGGSDFGKQLIKNICEIEDKILADKIIIFTGLEINPGIFEKYNPSDKIIIKQFTYNLIEWMQLSDLTIALAGHTTTMELISIKKPNILIPIKNHIEQERNINRIKPYNISETTKIDDKKQLINLINNMIDNIDKISINQEEYERFIRYNGCLNAVKIIKK